MAIDLKSKVVIVGGKYAEPMALKYGIYVCQPNRSFQDVDYIAFYHRKRIKYIFRIIDKESDVRLSASKIVANTVYLADNPALSSNVNDVYKLEPFIPVVITHNQKGTYVRNQRYTTIGKYLEAIDTSML